MVFYWKPGHKGTMLVEVRLHWRPSDVTYGVVCVSFNGQWMTGVGHYCLFLLEVGVSDQLLVLPTDLWICVDILFIAVGINYCTSWPFSYHGAAAIQHVLFWIAQYARERNKKSGYKYLSRKLLFVYFSSGFYCKLGFQHYLISE